MANTKDKSVPPAQTGPFPTAPGGATPGEDNETAQREYRNAVFAAQQASQAGGIPTVSRHDYARKELGLEIPIDSVPLPSKGKVYPPEHPLHLQESIDYRAMTAKEEDILMNPAFLKKGTVITELIKSCLLDPSIDVQTLLSGDRNALMIAIRASGYGASYEPTYTCPACEFKADMRIDLSSLGIKPLELDPVEPGANLFSFKLPKCGKTVAFRFLTGKEEEEIINEAESKKKKGLISSNTVTARLLRSVVEIDGNTNRSTIAQFVSYMPALDSLALRKHIDDNEPGVDMMIPFTCESCSHEEEITLPLGPTFFWPNAHR